MYKIEIKDYGYKMTFSGRIEKPEMEAWVAESKKVLLKHPDKFGVLVDMRELSPVSPDTREVMEGGQKLYKVAGMSRSAVAVPNAMLALQFKRVAQDSGIYEWERYVDAAKVDDWESACVGWVRDAKDPDA